MKGVFRTKNPLSQGGGKYKGRSAPESTVNLGKTPIHVILTEKVDLLGEVTVER